MKMLPHSVWNCINYVVFGTKKLIYRLKLSRKSFSPGPRKNVLVLACSGGVGNAIEATPLVQAIRTLWPSCHLTFAAVSGDLFDNWCVPDRIITTPQAIRGERFDHTYAAYLNEDIDAWKEQAQLGKIHTLNKWQKKWFLKPESAYYLGLLKSQGYKGRTPPCYVAVKKPHELPPETEFRICIAPCGKNEDIWKYKKWPYYSELIHALQDRYPNSQICIIGTKEDHLSVECDGRNIIDCRSMYSLSETAWLLKHSDLVVGNDCGPMHIADAVQARGIVIFGPTCVIKNGPRNKLIPIAADIKCCPCQYSKAIKKCSKPRCIQEVNSDMVFARLTSILEDND